MCDASYIYLNILAYVKTINYISRPNAFVNLWIRITFIVVNVNIEGVDI